MKYYFDQLDNPTRFQRLINGILVGWFGADARLTPLLGPDGGADGEIAPRNPHMEFRRDSMASRPSDLGRQPPRPGRYLFQVKFHRTSEQKNTYLRSKVVSEFRNALRDDILHRSDRDDVDYFVLVTNVSASKKAIDRVERIREELRPTRRRLHADVWWGERVTTELDWSFGLWRSFPELFPGHRPPTLAEASSQSPEGLARTLRLAVSHQHTRDTRVKFRQLELEQELLSLFVDVDVQFPVDDDIRRPSNLRARRSGYGDDPMPRNRLSTLGTLGRRHSALQLLINDSICARRILLEGGPGQGKSTVTQMAAQVYREVLLGRQDSVRRDPTWGRLCRLRTPIRVELKEFASWLSESSGGTFEQYIAHIISQDSGGSSISVTDLQSIVEGSALILFLDGLDEIANDGSRDEVLDCILDTVARFEDVLAVDLRVVLTTRPPAVVGRWNKLEGFTRVALTPMSPTRIDDYLDRWLHAQIETDDERRRIRKSFNVRRHDSHLEALARNPMQLSVLLQFIHLKGEAFPDRRAELYRDYFQIVVDRDVEKSPELAEHRELVEGLHSFLGFYIHGITEMDHGGRTLNRREIVRLAARWLESESRSRELADQFFSLGEERFGLIVARSGVGQSTSYGFEVQPIQEYFAASYISNRLIDANAHDVFQLLIHRSHWGEVALFLAGLRRPNEKADLVARAKAADDELLGHTHQHGGKAVVLQLLREGVLTQPDHVLREAMKFVFEVLTLPALRMHRTPHSLVHALSILGKRHGGRATHEKIIQVAQALSESEDYQLLQIVHRLAVAVLPAEQYCQLVSGHAGTQPDVRSLVRLVSPYAADQVICKLASSGGYWEGVPLPVLARDLWQTAVRCAVVRDLPYPSGMHSRLVQQFAVGQLVERNSPGRLLEVQAKPTPAIWGLQRNVQAIRWHLWNRDEDATINWLESATNALSWDDGNSEIVGQSVRDCAGDLIDSSNRVLAGITAANEAKVSQALREYLIRIRAHLADPGIPGWVACRCAVEVLQRGPLGGLQRYSVPRHVVFDLREELLRFYNPGESYRSRRFHFQEFLLLGMPQALRMSRDAEPRLLYQLIADLAHGRLSSDEHERCRWLEDVPIPRAALRPLVDSWQDDLAQLLRLIGRRGVTGLFIGRLLRVQQTQRILRICRETDDIRTLQGTAALLPNATFARLAEPNLIVKILSAAPSSQLVTRVLPTTGAVAGGRQLDSREKELARHVARLILDEPELHPFRIVNRAAAFTAEADPHGSTPLFEDRPDFWARVQDASIAPTG